LKYFASARLAMTQCGILFCYICRKLKELIYQDLRYDIVVVQDAGNMRKPKSVNVLNLPDLKKIKFVWKIRRQMQQEVLEDKLMHLLLNERPNIQYPEAMNPLIEDFMRKAEREIKREKTF
jgi:hypothetical protein